MIEQTQYEKVDWDGLKTDVNERIWAVQQCWRESEKRAPKETHEKLVKDIYLPAIKLLGEFCVCVKLGEK